MAEVVDPHWESHGHGKQRYTASVLKSAALPCAILLIAGVFCAGCSSLRAPLPVPESWIEYGPVEPVDHRTSYAFEATDGVPCRIIRIDGVLVATIYLDKGLKPISIAPGLGTKIDDGTPPFILAVQHEHRGWSELWKLVADDVLGAGLIERHRQIDSILVVQHFDDFGRLSRSRLIEPRAQRETITYWEDGQAARYEVFVAGDLVNSWIDYTVVDVPSLTVLPCGVAQPCRRP